jgi:hypothetical protein
LACSRELEGTIPITVPPERDAPRATASITPASPPQTTTAPASASRSPTSSAIGSSSLSGAPFPITDT